MKLLVTGGAGYIGSIVARVLIADGHEVVVLDNLERGHREAVPPQAQLIVGDLRNPDEVEQALAPGFDGVLHFAALALVGESVEHPERYYRTNVAGTLNLLEAMVAHKVPRLVFSSTCAVYGQPDEVPIPESAPPRPQNAYGASKLAADHLIGDFCVAHGIGAVSLRYFNVAGAHDGVGEDHEPETHLIPNILKVPLGQRDSVQIFGTDYPTPDGSAVRDYIHIDDLADAHALALAHARDRGAPDLQPRQRQRLLGARGDRGGRAGDGPVDPGGRGAAPPRRPAEADRRRPEGPRRARLGAAEARARDDDRRRLGLRPGAPARLQRQLKQRSYPGSKSASAASACATTSPGGSEASSTRMRCGSAGGELPVGVGDPREEVGALALEAVGRFPACSPRALARMPDRASAAGSGPGSGRRWRTG